MGKEGSERIVKRAESIVLCEEARYLNRLFEKCTKLEGKKGHSKAIEELDKESNRQDTEGLADEEEVIIYKLSQKGK